MRTLETPDTDFERALEILVDASDEIRLDDSFEVPKFVTATWLHENYMLTDRDRRLLSEHLAELDEDWPTTTGDEKDFYQSLADLLTRNILTLNIVSYWIRKHRPTKFWKKCILGVMHTRVHTHLAIETKNVGDSYSVTLRDKLENELEYDLLAEYLFVEVCHNRFLVDAAERINRIPNLPTSLRLFLVALLRKIIGLNEQSDQEFEITNTLGATEIEADELIVGHAAYTGIAAQLAELLGPLTDAPAGIPKDVISGASVFLDAVYAWENSIKSKEGEQGRERAYEIVAVLEDIGLNLEKIHDNNGEDLQQLAAELQIWIEGGSELDLKVLGRCEDRLNGVKLAFDDFQSCDEKLRAAASSVSSNTSHASLEKLDLARQELDASNSLFLNDLHLFRTEVAAISTETSTIQPFSAGVAAIVGEMPDNETEKQVLQNSPATPTSGSNGLHGLTEITKVDPVKATGGDHGSDDEVPPRGENLNETGLETSGGSEEIEPTEPFRLPDASEERTVKAFLTLIDQGDMSLALHLISSAHALDIAVDILPIPESMRLYDIGRSVRSPGSSASTACNRWIEQFLERLPQLDAEKSMGTASLLLAFAGLVRPALFAPESAAATLLEQLPLGSHLSFLHKLSTLIIDLAQQNYFQTIGHLSSGLMRAEAEKRENLDRKELEKWVDRVKVSNFAYHPATVVWSALMKPNGKLGIILKTIFETGPGASHIAAELVSELYSNPSQSHHIVGLEFAPS